jgi:hypothetical protein
LNKTSVQDVDMVIENYGEDDLVVLPIDPSSLFAYWEVSEERKRLVEQHFRCDWAILPKILRVYDVNCIEFNGDNANGSRSIPIDDGANRWIIREALPACSYCIDYGTTTIDGRFFTILRSNAVSTPPLEEYASMGEIQRSNANLSGIKDLPQRDLPEWTERFTGYSLTGSNT